MFREIGLEFNDRNVGDTNQLFQYRSILESLLTFCKEVQETRLLCEKFTKDTTEHMGVTAVGGNYACLNARAATFARSTVIELVGCPHLNVLNHKCLIPLKIDLHMELMPSPNNFVCKSAAPAQNAQQEYNKLFIQSVNLIIRTKKLTSTAHGALMDFFQSQTIVHHFSRVQIKHLSIPAN